jgi:hypothetical protein
LRDTPIGPIKKVFFLCVVYTFDFKTKLITSAEEEQVVILFHTKPRQNAWLFNVMEKIELPQYFLVFSNIKESQLPRLNLSFIIEERQLYSEQLKGYVLAEDQSLGTLQGLSQYLILEAAIVPNTENGIDRWVLIPNREIKDHPYFFSKQVQLNNNQVHSPTYFLYHIDLQLGRLKAETTAGKLYLALLYYKTASLDIDPLTGQASYEHIMQILSTCWLSV